MDRIQAQCHLTVTLAAKMADIEDDSGATRTITTAEPPGVPPHPPAAQFETSLSLESVAETTGPGEQIPTAPADQDVQLGDRSESSEPASCSQGGQPPQNDPLGSGVQLVDGLQSSPAEQSILLGPDFTELSSTTIIYVQPDGSLVEGSGLTAEEQQAVLNQLTKHQIVQVSETEAAQLLQQSQLLKTIPVQNTALDQNQLQQVINQVTKSQNQVHQPQKEPAQTQQGLKQQKQIQVPQQNLKPTTQTNASQQLKTVAQHVAMQTGTSVQVG